MYSFSFFVSHATLATWSTCKLLNLSTGVLRLCCNDYDSTDDNADGGEGGGSSKKEEEEECYLTM